MRNLTFTLLLLLAGSFVGNAQTTVFLEDFETVPSTLTSSSGTPGWFTNTRLQVSGLNCDSSNIVAPGSVSYLTTTPFSTAGNSYVTLTFNNICKADFFDGGVIQVSVDGGNTWTSLIDNNGNPGGLNNCNYLGTSNFRDQGSKFQEVSYPAWLPGNTTAVPTNSWWQLEEFDISALTGNQPDVRIRFRFTDNNNDGNAGRTGWYLDDVKVVIAPCELVLPTLTQDAPIYPANVYNLGPFTINATATDLSGILSITLYYSINGGTFVAVPMTVTTGNSYTAIIPAVNDQDQICYYIEAIDNSGCSNTTYAPGPTSANTICFTANQGITFPYCDYFDIPGIPWSGSGATAGTTWQLGVPASGVLNTAFSAPNAWVTNLSSPYGPNANAALVSPEMSFTTGAGATLEFWQNRNTQVGLDGFKLQWATNVNGPWTTLGAVGCIDCVNWYTDPSLTDLQPGWEGNSGGWVKSSIILDATFNNLPQVWFRFHFVSNASTQSDGVAIDNFCIFLPDSNDVGVTVINAPASSSPAGVCADVMVTVKNHGINPQTNFPVTYLTSTGLTGTANYTGPAIAPGATAQVTLPCFTVPVGPFSICAWTDLSNDGNHFNDTTCANSFGTPIFPVAQGAPYFDNFNTGATGWTGQVIPPGTNNTQWELGAPTFGVTSSSYSPPSCWDVNLTTGYQGNANCELLSPLFDFSQAANPYMTFWINHLCESGWDGTRLEYRIGGGAWTLLGGANLTPPCWVNWYNSTPNIISSNQPAWHAASNGWKKVEATCLPATFTNQPLPVQFRFIFTSDGSVNQDGFSIDDFTIAMPEPNDVGVVSIDQPASSSPAGTCADVEVTIKNHGTLPQTGFPVTYLTSTGLTGTANYTGPAIAPGATAQLILPCFTVPVGNFGICAWTELSTDANHFNDTSCTNSFGTPIYTVSTGNPYFDNFNTGATGWASLNPTGTPITLWELGAPAFGATSSSYSPPSCWDVNLNVGYGGNAACELLTPLFDLSQAVNPYMTFWINHNCEQGWDGTRLEYRIGGGAWTLLGAANLTPPCWVNWYNSAPNINSSNQPAWHAASNGWKKVEALCLPAILNNQPLPVQFRFIFTSDGAVNQDGFSIDDFTLALPEPDDVGVVSIDQPTGSSPAGNTVDVIVTVKNFGTNTQTTFPVTYVESPGAQTGTVTFNGNLLPGSSTQITIPGLVVPSGGFDICAWTGLATDSNHFNDTLCGGSVGIPLIAVTYTAPFEDDFDGVNIGWSTANSSGTPITQWELGAPTFGQTNSSFSPPNCWDVNLTSAYGNSAACELLSPMFDFSQAVDAKISFWRNNRCETGWDGTRLDYRIGNGAWTMLGAANLTAPCWVNWYNSTPNINATNQPAWMGASGGWVKTEATCLPAIFNNQPQPIQFRFLFASDPSVIQDGFSIDGFKIQIPVPLTAAPIVVNTNTVNNNFIFPGQPVQFSSPISNPGTTPLTSVIATVTIDGVPFTSDTIYYSPALPSAQNLLHTFLQNWTAAPGVYDVCVITSEPNFGVDLNPFDDTTCITISVFDTVSITSANGYCTDFESGPQWIAANATTLNNTLCSWQLGTPAQALINGASSGQNAWMTNLSTDYPSRDTSALFTPVFAIDTTKCYRITFNHIFKTEPWQDGGVLEFSNDYATTWHHVGVTSANNPNWYNTAFITALGGLPPLPGWSGTQASWQQALQEYQFWGSNTIMLRFRFASDNTVNSEGWAIDDFCLEEIPGFCVVSVPEVIGGGLILGQNQPNPFSESTTIHFALPNAGQTKLYVTDVLGREIMTLADDRLESGTHSFEINGKTLNAGIYYYTLEFEGHEITRKMVLTR